MVPCVRMSAVWALRSSSEDLETEASFRDCSRQGSRPCSSGLAVNPISKQPETTTAEIEIDPKLLPCIVNEKAATAASETFSGKHRLS